MQLRICSGRHFEETFGTHLGEKPYKCNQCVYASARAGSLKTHLKTHSGEIQCTLCDYASVTAGNLRTHLKIHLGEKSYKCNQWDYASVRHVIWGHIWKCTLEKSHTNAANATMHPFGQIVWGHIWKLILEKSKNKCNQCDNESVGANHLRTHLKT